METEFFGFCKIKSIWILEATVIDTLQHEQLQSGEQHSTPSACPVWSWDADTLSCISPMYFVSLQVIQQRNKMCRVNM